jgi:hypothetical protein
MSSHGIGSTKDLDLVGYRVVHGGKCYSDPVRIDDEVIAAIEKLEDLAPLHNAGSASVIRAGRRSLGEAIPSIAVFDTALSSRWCHCAEVGWPEREALRVTDRLRGASASWRTWHQALFQNGDANCTRRKFSAACIRRRDVLRQSGRTVVDTSTNRAQFSMERLDLEVSKLHTAVRK